VQDYVSDRELEGKVAAVFVARLVDGASEVHQQVLARFFLEERGDFWRWA